MKFNTENPIFQFLGTLADYTILNIIFLITCIPVVTIGPAITALFSVTLQNVRNEGSGIVKSYFHAFKQSFRCSLALFFIYFFIGSVLIFNFSFWLTLHTAMANIALLFLILFAILYLFSLFYVFALTARFENTLKQTIKNSVLLALANPRQTMLLCLIFIILIALIYVSTIFRVFLMIFGFAFFAYCASFPLTKVFEKYEETPDISEIKEGIGKGIGEKMEEKDIQEERYKESAVASLKK